MEQQINIATLLKDCPKGTKLYSPAYGEVELLKETNDLSIMVADKYGNKFSFNFYGGFSLHGECLLFPSNEVRDWGCFRVKYVRLTDDYNQNCRLIEPLCTNNIEFAKSDIKDCDSTCYAYQDAVDKSLAVSYDEVTINYILSTGTELKLEEEQPKFKVGDVVKGHDGSFYAIVDKHMTETTKYEISPVIYPKDFCLATPEEIDKWNEETLHPNHLHYSKSKRKIIHWFLPFDRIICRDDYKIWQADFYSSYDETMPNSPYRGIGAFWKECLPYNSDTAKLIGTTNDYKEDE